MKLYKLNALYLGKDLEDKVIIEYFLAENEEAAFKHIDENYGYWTADYDPETYGPSDKIKNIKEAHGDFNEDYNGEFYDVKYQWEEIGNIIYEDIVILKKFNILKEVK